MLNPKNSRLLELRIKKLWRYSGLTDTHLFEEREV